MDRFVLTGDLITQVSPIDVQHKKLFEIANRVVDPAVMDQGATFFEGILEFLESYVEYHFAGEESVMADIDYPRLDLHRQWHHQFRSEVAEIRGLARTALDSKGIKLRVSFAIENWLTDHIRISDRHFAEFLMRQSGTHPIMIPNVNALKAAGLISKDFEERFAAG